MKIVHLIWAWASAWGSVLNAASALSLTSASLRGVAGVASIVVKAGYWVLCGFPQPRERR